MANEEHLAILKQGVVTWNRWRNAHQEIRPELSEAELHAADLSGADLSETNLFGANLSRADLSRADLHWADLHGANLSRADLSRADLHEVTLNRADLHEANLSEANLSEANLNEANLSEANLSEADLDTANLSGASLIGANLSGANLSGAILSRTDLDRANLNAANLNRAMMWDTHLNNLNLQQVKSLETVVHRGPSDIGIQAVYQSHGDIPEIFLRGAGVPDSFIEYMRSLVGNPIDYYSCFISYSSQDEAFTKRLYADLQNEGVRCWFAPEDLKIGDKFWERIDASIRVYDKLLVVLSVESVASAWVEDEVMRALERERQQPGRLVLFPVRLDDAVLTAQEPWASGIRMKRHIGDFSRWKDHDAYQTAFARLLRDLKAGAALPPEPASEEQATAKRKRQ